MIDEIGGTTSSLVILALDAAIQRHSLIANNIANVNTEGFRGQSLSFDALMSQLNVGQLRNTAEDESLKQDIAQAKEALMDGNFVEEGVNSKVALDEQMAQLSENVIRYRALLEGLSKRSSIINMAISLQGSK